MEVQIFKLVFGATHGNTEIPEFGATHGNTEIAEIGATHGNTEIPKVGATHGNRDILPGFMFKLATGCWWLR